MSGPIVRRYGFPNFEKIFGERPLQHGAAEAEGQAGEPNSESASTHIDPSKRATATEVSPPTELGNAVDNPGGGGK